MVKFGTSGWRGIIGREVTFRRVRMVTQAIVDYLSERESVYLAGLALTTERNEYRPLFGLGGGVISGKKLFQEAERYLGDKDIMNLKSPFVAVTIRA